MLKRSVVLKDEVRKSELKLTERHYINRASWADHEWFCNSNFNKLFLEVLITRLKQSNSDECLAK